MRNILCYGDSNTWGFIPGKGERYPLDVRWTGRLQEELGKDYHIIEEGQNARTTIYDDNFTYWRNGRDYLPACLVSQKPLDLMIISLGTNDLKFTDAYGAAKGVESLISTTAMVQNYKNDVAVFPNGMKILVISPIHLGEDYITVTDSVFQYKYAESLKFTEYYKRMCERTGAYFLDASEYARPSGTDRVHMEPEDHAALAHAIAEKVKEIFADE